MGVQSPTKHQTPEGMQALFRGCLFAASSDAWTKYNDNMATEQLYRHFLAAVDKSGGFQIAQGLTKSLSEIQTEIQVAVKGRYSYNAVDGQIMDISSDDE
jgi:hypothetical protein